MTLQQARSASITAPLQALATIDARRAVRTRKGWRRAERCTFRSNSSRDSDQNGGTIIAA